MKKKKKVSQKEVPAGPIERIVDEQARLAELRRQAERILKKS